MMCEDCIKTISFDGAFHRNEREYSYLEYSLLFLSIIDVLQVGIKEYIMEFRTKKLSVKVTPQEFEAINEYCQALQISKSVFIRNLIHKELFE